MKTKLLFLSIALLCSATSTLFGYKQKESNFREGAITVQDYCTFLNETAENQAVDCKMLVRSGTPESYYYEVTSGEADAAMSFLSLDDVVAYCEWKNESLPFPTFSLLGNSQIGNSDHSLKSNLFVFRLMKMEGTIHEAGGAEIAEVIGAEEIEEGIGLALLLGWGVGERSRSQSPSFIEGLSSSRAGSPKQTSSMSLYRSNEIQEHLRTLLRKAATRNPEVEIASRGRIRGSEAFVARETEKAITLAKILQPPLESIQLLDWQAWTEKVIRQADFFPKGSSLREAIAHYGMAHSEWVDNEFQAAWALRMQQSMIVEKRVASRKNQKSLNQKEALAEADQKAWGAIIGREFEVAKKTNKTKAKNKMREATLQFKAEFAVMRSCWNDFLKAKKLFEQERTIESLERALDATYGAVKPDTKLETYSTSTTVDALATLNVVTDIFSTVAYAVASAGAGALDVASQASYEALTLLSDAFDHAEHALDTHLESEIQWALLVAQDAIDFGRDACDFYSNQKETKGLKESAADALISKPTSEERELFQKIEQQEKMISSYRQKIDEANIQQNHGAKNRLQMALQFAERSLQRLREIDQVGKWKIQFAEATTNLPESQVSILWEEMIAHNDSLAEQYQQGAVALEQDHLVGMNSWKAAFYHLEESAQWTTEAAFHINKALEAKKEKLSKLAECYEETAKQNLLTAQQWSHLATAVNTKSGVDLEKLRADAVNHNLKSYELKKGQEAERQRSTLPLTKVEKEKEAPPFLILDEGERLESSSSSQIVASSAPAALKPKMPRRFPSINFNPVSELTATEGDALNDKGIQEVSEPLTEEERKLFEEVINHIVKEPITKILLEKEDEIIGDATGGMTIQEDVHNSVAVLLAIESNSKLIEAVREDFREDFEKKDKTRKKRGGHTLSRYIDKDTLNFSANSKAEHVSTNKGDKSPSNRELIKPPSSKSLIKKKSFKNLREAEAIKPPIESLELRDWLKWSSRIVSLTKENTEQLTPTWRSRIALEGRNYPTWVAKEVWLAWRERQRKTVDALKELEKNKDTIIKGAENAIDRFNEKMIDLQSSYEAAKEEVKRLEEENNWVKVGKPQKSKQRRSSSLTSFRSEEERKKIISVQQELACCKNAIAEARKGLIDEITNYRIHYRYMTHQINELKSYSLNDKEAWSTIFAPIVKWTNAVDSWNEAMEFSKVAWDAKVQVMNATVDLPEVVEAAALWRKACEAKKEATEALNNERDSILKACVDADAAWAEAKEKTWLLREARNKADNNMLRWSKVIEKEKAAEEAWGYAENAKKQAYGLVPENSVLQAHLDVEMALARALKMDRVARTAEIQARCQDFTLERGDALFQQAWNESIEKAKEAKTTWEAFINKCHSPKFIKFQSEEAEWNENLAKAFYWTVAYDIQHHWLYAEKTKKILDAIKNEVHKKNLPNKLLEEAIVNWHDICVALKGAYHPSIREKLAPTQQLEWDNRLKKAEQLELESKVEHYRFLKNQNLNFPRELLNKGGRYGASTYHTAENIEEELKPFLEEEQSVVTASIYSPFSNGKKIFGIGSNKEKKERKGLSGSLSQESFNTSSAATTKPTDFDEARIVEKPSSLAAREELSTPTERLGSHSPITSEEAQGIKMERVVSFTSFSDKNTEHNIDDTLNFLGSSIPINSKRSFKDAEFKWSALDQEAESISEQALDLQKQAEKAENGHSASLIWEKALARAIETAKRYQRALEAFPKDEEIPKDLKSHWRENLEATKNNIALWSVYTLLCKMKMLESEISVKQNEAKEANPEEATLLWDALIKRADSLESTIEEFKRCYNEGIKKAPFYLQDRWLQEDQWPIYFEDIEHDKRTLKAVTNWYQAKKLASEAKVLISAAEKSAAEKKASHKQWNEIFERIDQVKAAYDKTIHGFKETQKYGPDRLQDDWIERIEEAEDRGLHWAAKRFEEEAKKADYFASVAHDRAKDSDAKDILRKARNKREKARDAFLKVLDLFQEGGEKAPLRLKAWWENKIKITEEKIKELTEENSFYTEEIGSTKSTMGESDETLSVDKEKKEIPNQNRLETTNPSTESLTTAAPTQVEGYRHPHSSAASHTDIGMPFDDEPILKNHDADAEEELGEFHEQGFSFTNLQEQKILLNLSLLNLESSTIHLCSRPRLKYPCLSITAAAAFCSFCIFQTYRAYSNFPIWYQTRIEPWLSIQPIAKLNIPTLGFQFVEDRWNFFSINHKNSIREGFVTMGSKAAKEDDYKHFLEFASTFEDRITQLQKVVGNTIPQEILKNEVNYMVSPLERTKRGGSADYMAILGKLLKYKNQDNMALWKSGFSILGEKTSFEKHQSLENFLKANLFYQKAQEESHHVTTVMKSNALKASVHEAPKYWDMLIEKAEEVEGLFHLSLLVYQNGLYSAVQLSVLESQEKWGTAVRVAKSSNAIWKSTILSFQARKAEAMMFWCYEQAKIASFSKDTVSALTEALDQAKIAQSYWKNISIPCHEGIEDVSHREELCKTPSWVKEKEEKLDKIIKKLMQSIANLSQQNEEHY